MMTEIERYEQFDMPLYRDKVLPVMPRTVLDFHAHAWCADQCVNPSLNNASRLFSLKPDGAGALGGEKANAYMVTRSEYNCSQLQDDINRIFPDNEYNMLVFGNPSPHFDLTKTNAHVAAGSRSYGFYPLIIVGRNTMPIDELEKAIYEHGFFGYKVFLDWIGDDYGHVSIGGMIGPKEMSLADRLGLIVLLHVPRAGRLVDPEVRQGVVELAQEYPNASIVLAHCGRCYTPRQMIDTAKTLRYLDNVYLDTAMVMDPTVLQVAFDAVGPRRVLYGSDFPVPRMRGRRVYVMDHWVDVVLGGYPESSFRVSGDNIQATFMAYEIVMAISLAGELAGLSDKDIHRAFYDNGMDLLNHVMEGRQMECAQRRLQQCQVSAT